MHPEDNQDLIDAENGQKRRAQKRKATEEEMTMDAS